MALLTRWAASGSTLYAGGAFTTATNGDGLAVPVNHIAQWNGTEWSALGAGVNNQVYALAVSDADVDAGGNFTSVGGVAANLIAQWNGIGWSPLGSGICGNGFNGAAVSALTVLGTSLFVGGSFTMAGTIASSYAAQAILAPPSIISTNSSFGFTDGSRQFGFDVSGGPLQRVVIEASTDLRNWVPLQTNLLGGPLTYFKDPFAGSFSRRLYRVVLGQ